MYIKIQYLKDSSYSSGACNQVFEAFLGFGPLGQAFEPQTWPKENQPGLETAS